MTWVPEREIVVKDSLDESRVKDNSLRFYESHADSAFYRVFKEGSLVKNGYVGREQMTELRDFLNERLGEPNVEATFTKADMDRVYESGREAGLRDARDEFERIAYTYRENIRYARKD